MIYTIAEFIATVFDCAILFWFLIFSLSFKKIPTSLKIIITSLFSAVMLLNIIILNYHFTLEGIFTVFYLIILFSFSAIALQGKWWHQLVLSLVGLTAIFLTNAIITVLSSIIISGENCLISTGICFRMPGSSSTTAKRIFASLLPFILYHSLLIFSTASAIVQNTQ